MRTSFVLMSFLASWALATLIGSSVALADTNADLLIHLFNDACIQNMGHPDETRRWAKAQHFSTITHPDALKLFVGDNTSGKGAAWNVPSLTSARFALSLRGLTQACSVYAERADVATVESMFLQEVIGAIRPGIAIRKDTEKVTQNRFGLAKQLIYIATMTGNTDKGYEFILTTAELPGGPYQASIQVVPTLLH